MTTSHYSLRAWCAMLDRNLAFEHDCLLNVNRSIGGTNVSQCSFEHDYLFNDCIECMIANRGLVAMLLRA